nr:hypothetical protein [Kibdelosporangium sp. MJ126-NF4]CEL14045.1 hypothetical protein [Kibdelosporangium sp. MJ126-NF4]
MSSPIPGDPDELEHEISRYRDLVERCHQAEKDLENLPVDEWRGQSAQAFDAHRETMKGQVKTARIAFDDTAEALDRYRETLITVQSLAKYAIQRAQHDGNWVRANEDIDLWRGQNSAEAAIAARDLQDATGRLRSISALVTDRVPDAPTPNPPLGSVIRLKKSDRQRPTHRPVTPEDETPRMRHDRIRALCDAVLDASYVSADDL